MYDFDNQQVIEPKRQFTGVWIPSEVMLDERLSAVDKILYAEIASFGDKGCWKRSEELQQICGVKRDGLQAACKRLRGCGYISESKTISGRMVRRATIGFNPQPSNRAIWRMQTSSPVCTNKNNEWGVDYVKRNTGNTRTGLAAGPLCHGAFGPPCNCGRKLPGGNDGKGQSGNPDGWP